MGTRGRDSILRLLGVSRTVLASFIWSQQKRPWTPKRESSSRTSSGGPLRDSVSPETGLSAALNVWEKEVQGGELVQMPGTERSHSS